MQIAVLYVLLVLIGLVVGGITGIVGASGVVVVVPILLLLTGVDTYTALGISLMVDFIASIIVSLTYFRKGNVQLYSGLWMILGTVAGSQIGVLFAHMIPENALGFGFSIGIMVIGAGMVIKGIIDYVKNRKPLEITESPLELEVSEVSTESVLIDERIEKSKDEDLIEKNCNHTPKIKKKWLEIVLLILFGFIIGFTSGLSGAGGGILLIFVCTGLLGLTLHKAIGTSTMVMCITALSGFVGFAMQGSINYLYGVFLAIGSVIGGIASARIANAINEDILRIIFGCINVGLGIATFFLW